MALTRRERRILSELEAGLSEISGRPHLCHLGSAAAAHWRSAVPAGTGLTAATTLAGLLTDALTVVVAVLAGAVAAWRGWVIWQDGVNRAAGD
jgi:hypothetical protein